jgi:hypothetical protein
MNGQKRRHLVLRDESIRHPFRQSLPIEFMQTARAQHELDSTTPAKKRRIGEDASMFMLSFFAFFTAFYMFIF